MLIPDFVWYLLGSYLLVLIYLMWITNKLENRMQELEHFIDIQSMRLKKQFESKPAQVKKRPYIKSGKYRKKNV